MRTYRDNQIKNMSLPKHHLELLSPARDVHIAREAILHGADAVYIGGPSFGARHNACNEVSDIARLVEFARRYHAWKGGALGLEHTLRQSAFLRPGNVSSKVDGLLYAGASTVPGVGLPMCLISAELVLKRLSGDRSALPVTG